MKFNLKGYNIDNLIRVLYNKKIKLYNIKKDGLNSVSFEVEDSQVKKVKRYISNYKVKQSLIGVKKIPALIFTNVGILLGVFLGFIFNIFASNYIWQIKIYGTKELSSSEILSVLEKNGVKKGKLNLKSSKAIEDILLNNYNRIAQVSVIKQGTAIIINLSEKLVCSEIEYQPIKAKYNGIIKQINLITGTLNVKIGDYVNEGDILVFPFNLDANYNKISVQPIAEIMAEILIVSKCSINKEEQILVRSGNKYTTYRYKIFNFNLFSRKNKNSFALFDLVVYNENIGDILPFSRDILTYYELIGKTKINNFEEEKPKLIEKSKNLAYKDLPIGEIEEESTHTTIVNDTMFAITNITILGIIND